MILTAISQKVIDFEEETYSGVDVPLPCRTVAAIENTVYDLQA